MKKLLFLLLPIIMAFMPISSPSFYAQKYPDADVNICFTLSLPAGKETVIHWGDGNTDTVTGPQTQNIYCNVYGDTGAYYNVTMTGDVDSITYLSPISNPLKLDICQFCDLMPNMETIIVAGDVEPDRLYGSINCYKKVSSLVWIVLHKNADLIGDISNLSGLTSLTNISLGITGVGGDLASLSPLTNLVNLSIYSVTGTISYTQGTLPDWDAANISIYNIGLSQQEVDDFLCDLDSASSASTKTLTIGSGGSNAAPSATGTTCKTSLQGKGWTVNTN